MAADTNPAITQTAVRSGEVQLNVATAGTGPPVLLLHGFPDCWQLWRAQIDALAGNGFRVIAPDLRGHRGIGSAGRCCGLPHAGADQSTSSPYWGISMSSSAAVVGHDWGAALAWNFTHRHPEMVDRLAVLSVGHPGANLSAGIRQRQLSWYMLWFLHVGVAEKVLPGRRLAGVPTVGVERCRTGRPRADGPADRRPVPAGGAGRALNLYRANIRPGELLRDQRAADAARRLPVLGVWSTGDPFLSEEQMTGSAAYVDGPWRYEQVPGGHWIPAQAAGAVHALAARLPRLTRPGEHVLGHASGGDQLRPRGSTWPIW